MIDKVMTPNKEIMLINATLPSAYIHVVIIFYWKELLLFNSIVNNNIIRFK